MKLNSILLWSSINNRLDFILFAWVTELHGGCLSNNQALHRCISTQVYVINNQLLDKTLTSRLSVKDWQLNLTLDQNIYCNIASLSSPNASTQRNKHTQTITNTSEPQIKLSWKHIATKNKSSCCISRLERSATLLRPRRSGGLRMCGAIQQRAPPLRERLLPAHMPEHIWLYSALHACWPVWIVNR